MKRRIAACLCTVLTLAFAFTGCGRSANDTGNFMTETGTDSDYSESDVSTFSAAKAVADSSYADNASVESMDGSDLSSEVTEEAAAETTDSETTSRKLIRTMSIEAETESFDEFIEGIEAKTEALGGYAESVSVYGSTDDRRSAYYTLRIPADKADSFIENVGEESNITSRSENVEDVTLTYVDITSRKEALETEYARLEELMKNAETVEDIISIEDRMSEVRYEIDSIESQLRTYDNRIDYTTIDLTIYEVKDYTESPDPDPTYLQRLTRSMKYAFSGLGEFLQNLSIFLIVAIPILAILAVPVVLIVLVLRFIVKKIRRAHSEKKARKETKAKAENREQKTDS